MSVLLAYRLGLQPVALCQPWLTVDEWRYCQAQRTKRQLEFANGRALIRKMLMAKYALAISDIEITLPGKHAPLLTLPQQNLYLSVSHTRQAISVAVSNDPIGLDLEAIKTRDYYSFIPPFVALNGVDSLDAFYRRWTACEAYSKYSGISLWQVLQQPLPDSIALNYLTLSGNLLCLCSGSNNLNIEMFKESI